jgi:hypothetical protein
MYCLPPTSNVIGGAEKPETDVDLPQFVERGVIERRNCAIEQREKKKPAAGRERAAEIRVHALL